MVKYISHGHHTSSMIEDEVGQIKNRILNWINNDTLTTYKAIDEGKYDSVKYPYLLKIQTPKVGDIYIFKPKAQLDKISVYARVDFTEDNQKAFNALNPEFKNKLLLEISQGITMMNLIVKFHPNYLNLQNIHFQEMIYFDGLSKDRIMNSLSKVLNAYGYVIVILQKNGIIRERFDPSDFV